MELEPTLSVHNNHDKPQNRLNIPVHKWLVIRFEVKWSSGYGQIQMRGPIFHARIIIDKNYYFFGNMSHRIEIETDKKRGSLDNGRNASEFPLNNVNPERRF